MSDKATLRISGNARRKEILGFPKGPQPLGTLTLLARSSVLYLCEGDGANRRFRILSPRCFPAYPSPQQRDTRSLSSFQKRIYGNWTKKLRTYVPTNPPGRVIYKWFCRGFAYRRLSRSALGRTPPPSAVFKIIVMGIKKKSNPFPIWKIRFGLY